MSQELFYWNIYYIIYICIEFYFDIYYKCLRIIYTYLIENSKLSKTNAKSLWTSISLITKFSILMLYL